MGTPTRPAELRVERNCGSFIGVPKRFAVAVLLLIALVAAACSSSSGPKLVGTPWHLASYQVPGGSLIPAAVASQGSSLSFADGAHVAGFTGCHSFSGTYLASGSTLTITPQFTTATCPTAELTAQQNAMKRQLHQVRSYAINDDVLALRGATGATLFTYRQPGPA